MVHCFSPQRPSQFGDLPELFPRTLLKNETYNGMPIVEVMMKRFGKRKMVEKDWGKGSWYNGKVAWDR